MRAVAEQLGRRLKQQVVIENRPGAGATIGSELVAKAAPDGYTLLLASQTNAISATLYPQAHFPPDRRLRADLAASAASPACWSCIRRCRRQTCAELIALCARRDPGKIDYASSGNGSGQHLFAAMFASMAGIKLNHVPYKGSGQATTDLLGGMVPMAIPGTAGDARAHQGRQAARAGRHRRAARRRSCPTCRRWPKPAFPATRPMCGWACWRRRARRAPIIERLQRELMAALAHARGEDLHGRRRHRDRRARRPPSSARSSATERDRWAQRRSRKPAPRSTEPDVARTSNRMTHDARPVTGVEHWTHKKRRRRRAPVPVGEVRRLARRQAGRAVRARLVDGLAADLRPRPCPGGRDSSVMDWFAERGFVCWCVDMEGYGRSDKHARHLLRHRQRRRRPRRGHRLHRRDARRAQLPDLRHLARARCAPRCSRSAIPSAWRALRSMPSCGPATAPRRSNSGARSCPSSWPPSAGRSTAPSCIRSSTRDHPDCADKRTVEAFADAILALDDSMPNGTYIDMCSQAAGGRPGEDHACRRSCCAASSTASPAFDDLIEFFERLPSPTSSSR